MPDTKKTGSRKSTASRKKETEATQPIQIPSQVIDFQKRVLDGQRAFFDTAYSAVTAMQDSQESVWSSLLERASFVPERAQEISVAWADNRREARETYKEVVYRNFSLVEEWIDGLASSRA